MEFFITNSGEVATLPGQISYQDELYFQGKLLLQIVLVLETVATFSGKRLEKHRRLSDYGFQNDVTLQVVRIVSVSIPASPEFAFTLQFDPRIDTIDKVRAQCQEKQYTKWEEGLLLSKWTRLLCMRGTINSTCIQIFLFRHLGESEAGIGKWDVWLRSSEHNLL